MDSPTPNSPATAIPSTNDRLTSVFNTPRKRLFLFGAKMAITLGGFAGMFLSLATSNPILAAASTALTVYTLRAGDPRLGIEQPAFRQPEPYKLSKWDVGAVILAAAAAGFIVDHKKERARATALPRYTGETVTIPGSTMSARDYFCSDVTMGIVAKKLPNNGPERSFDCGKQIITPR